MFKKKRDNGYLAEMKPDNSLPSHIRQLLDFEEDYEIVMGWKNKKSSPLPKYGKGIDYGDKLLIKKNHLPSPEINEESISKESVKTPRKTFWPKPSQSVRRPPSYPVVRNYYFDSKKKSAVALRKKNGLKLEKAAEEMSYREIWKADEFFGNKNVPKKAPSGIAKKKIFQLERNLFKKIFFSFSLAAVAIALFFSGRLAWERSKEIKGKVLGSSEQAFNQINSAISKVSDRNFSASAVDFEMAYQSFSEASEEIEGISGYLIDLTRKIPVLSKASSGKELVESGKNLSVAGKKMSETAEYLMELRNPIRKPGEDLSLMEIFHDLALNLTEAQIELKEAELHIEKVRVEDLPADKREQFLKLKTKLPEIIQAGDIFLSNSHIFEELLGGNGPRKYLFLFQNNQEMRATGGFIGSYGLLDIKDGRVRNFFIDGIFNPDGQFRDRVIPPKPIQKISVNWSLHDSNWFPDFPRSAEKAILFYEKTGGPTVDGIITVTPTVMEQLLEITGPIEMPEYGVTLNSENFIAETQYEVEIDYDKEDNRPKKILADLAPLVLDRIFNADDWKKMLEAVNILSRGLGEKHILLYSSNSEIQSIISSQGWSGEILETQGDYLNVINTNINGFKTDGVIDQSIEHRAEIQEDGTIIDQVTIARKHNGGGNEHEWWNKVNADYMRVYVPKGSQLISVEGQTRETIEAPVDYHNLGFRTDPEIEAEENSILIDEKSGTRVYEDSGKTVFANWVYVSPQEEATITYTYQLPFRLNFEKEGHPADSYSFLAQKQSGSRGSELDCRLIFPNNYEIIRKLPDEVKAEGNKVTAKTKLEYDFLYGAVFKIRE